MLDLDSTSEFPLEGIDMGPANEGVVGDDGGNGAVNLVLDALVLQLQIGEGNQHRHLPYSCAGSRRAGLPA